MLWWTKKEQLDKDQIALIEKLPLRECFLILGPPGSGKTNVLLRRAQFVRGQNMPNVLVLTFTRPLAEFVKTGSGPFAAISRLFSSDTSSNEDKERRALDEFVGRRSIARVERTYALNISFTSTSPVAAAKIANAIADAYIDDQLEAK